MKEGIASKAIRREDYTPYPWQIEDFRLQFEIGRKITTVTSRMRFRRVDDTGGPGPVRLDGQSLELVSVAVDGDELQPDQFQVDANYLTIPSAPAECEITTVVRIRPHENTALEGLYPSGDFLLTQCEAEGFRKITYFPDRPDVMTNYDVTIIADRDRFPVLLSNGNLVESSRHEDGRHVVRWVDPYRKPSYLFALVAGDLEFIEDTFTTRSGRNVTLRVYVEQQNLDKCSHAMTSLIKSMRWDEERFNLEYDLDIYNIVATDDFNMGAMENKSLNIFNSKYVLARPDTATDMDYQAIEAVIGHEYFHNWTGNRVTCRDWFQLTLKEGLTVFRDQEFSADMQSRAVKRIRDVRDLRSWQFPEDAGPMSHPIRPDHYVEINNFYTMTVYQKGATIIRMYHTLLGEGGFQKGMKLYFERHDGQAVTCDDFLAAMSDANGVDLEAFGKWYGQSGTPEVTVSGQYDADKREYTLHLSQETPATPDQSEKQALVIPFAVGLLSAKGEEIPLRLRDSDGSTNQTALLILDQPEQTFVFADVPAHPIPSLLRGFSAPVKLHYQHRPANLAILIQHDPDSFVRWEAAQLLAQQAIMSARQQHSSGQEMHLDPHLSEAFKGLLEDKVSDPALLAEAMILPDEDYLGQQMSVVDVDGLHQARNFVRKSLAASLGSLFRDRYDRLNTDEAYEISARAMARRSLKNLCLSYLAETKDGEQLLNAQLASSNNMTDTLAALGYLVYRDAPSAALALGDFEGRWNHDSLVMDKWFALQARHPGDRTVRQLDMLMEHPAFSLTNPNKVRSLVGAFAMGNPTGFHIQTGAGYRWVADRVIELNRLNPQVASRMVSAFNRWRRYDQARQELMQTELERISSTPGLSPDVAEIVGNALR